MPMSSHTQPSTVPESVLKKRKRDEQWAAQKAAAAADAKKASEAKREEIFKRAEKYVKEYRDQVSVRCARDADAMSALLEVAFRVLCAMRAGAMTTRCAPVRRVVAMSDRGKRSYDNCYARCTARTIERTTDHDVCFTKHRKPTSPLKRS
jgi:Ribosomal L30 N-terminal domain.